MPILTKNFAINITRCPVVASLANISSKRATKQEQLMEVMVGGLMEDHSIINNIRRLQEVCIHLTMMSLSPILGDSSVVLVLKQKVLLVATSFLVLVSQLKLD